MQYRVHTICDVHYELLRPTRAYCGWVSHGKRLGLFCPYPHFRVAKDMVLFIYQQFSTCGSKRSIHGHKKFPISMNLTKLKHSPRRHCRIKILPHCIEKAPHESIIIATRTVPGGSNSRNRPS